VVDAQPALGGEGDPEVKVRQQKSEDKDATYNIIDQLYEIK
jgi:hypothetical protein